MSAERNEVVCTFGERMSGVFHTKSLCPARDVFSRIDQRELIFDLASGRTYDDIDFPAVMCGDLGLSKSGVESLHFKLPSEPGFYKVDFGFLNLTHKQVIKGDNCKYPIARGRGDCDERKYDGRMKEENALHYIKYHGDQLEADDPQVVLGFDEIDEMDHQPDYARIEILLDGVEIDAFQLSGPILVREGGNRFVGEVCSKAIALTSQRLCRGASRRFENRSVGMGTGDLLPANGRRGDDQEGRLGL